MLQLHISDNAWNEKSEAAVAWGGAGMAALMLVVPDCIVSLCNHFNPTHFIYPTLMDAIQHKMCHTLIFVLGYQFPSFVR